jgi:membrane-associated phospholipid phosphatase
VIEFAPGARLWSLAPHAAWLTGPVIWLTAGCLIATPLLLLLAWLRPAGLRCILAVALGLVVLVLVAKQITAVSFVARPFVAHHFKPLYPHAPDTSFPSVTTGCFAVVAAAALLAWRRLGWIFVAITCEVAAGCVYVGVHYITDVVAGALIGAASGGAAWLILGCPPIAWLVARADGLLGHAHLRRSAVTPARQ